MSAAIDSEERTPRVVAISLGGVPSPGPPLPWRWC